MFRIFAMAGAVLAASIGAVAPAASPYRLVATTPLPQMPEGDFDQLAADVLHDRLFVSAEDGATIYVFSLTTGALIRSGGTARSPHKIIWDERHGHVLVADGEDGSVKVFDPNLTQIARIFVGPKADTGVLDPANHVFYVSSRDPATPDSQSLVSAISTDDLKIRARYRLPATTLKGLVLDKAGHRLLVSMRDKNAIGIVHLNTAEIDVWQPPELHKPVPLAIDPSSHTVFAGSRAPGELDMLDWNDGHVLATVASTETSDSISFDGHDRMIYLSGDSGMSRYQVGVAGAPRLLETDPSVVGKTSLYVRALHRLYVMRPKKDGQVAALTVFATAGR